jgi:hypothetical protein
MAFADHSNKEMPDQACEWRAGDAIGAAAKASSSHGSHSAHVGRAILPAAAF